MVLKNRGDPLRNPFVGNEIRLEYFFVDYQRLTKAEKERFRVKMKKNAGDS